MISKGEKFCTLDKLNFIPLNHMQSLLALQVDPFHTLNLETDSSLALAYEGQQRGHQVFTYQVQNLAWDRGNLVAHGSFVRLTPSGYEIMENAHLCLKDTSVLLIRQDPPFDSRYLSNTYLLEELENSVKVLNSPRGIRNGGEKTLPLQFPSLIPPTLISESASEIHQFSLDYDEIIIKPLFGHGGRDIMKIAKPSFLMLQTLIDLYQSKFQSPLVVQRYLNEIVQGDKRILMLDGDPVAVFRRIPKKGDIRSNLVQGGHAELCTLSRRDRDICDALAPTLRRLGLYFVGIDVIGEYLIEVNVTSPTGILAVKRLYDLDIAKLFWDRILKC